MVGNTTSDHQAGKYPPDEYVGKSLLDLPTPSAILDLSKVRRNYARMLEAVDTLQVDWRVHIKTHKVMTLLLAYTYSSVRSFPFSLPLSFS